jgi:hypothetical protein
VARKIPRFIQLTTESFLKGVAFALGTLATGLIAATLSSSLTTFNSGDLISSSAMNANFTAINNRLGSYCGVTANTNGVLTSGGLTGYLAAKALCETACGASTAHMCTAHEVSISQQMGESIPAGWYSSYDRNELNGTDVGADCIGWTSSSATDYGSVTTGGAGGNQRPSTGPCSSTGQPVLCCN